MLNFGDVILVTLFLVVFGPDIHTAIYNIKVKKSAERMGLRDKGKVEGNWFCDYCDTQSRIGIDESGEAHHYCWRCEVIFDDDQDPDDDGDGEEIPKEDQVVENERKVVDISKHRRQKKVA